MAHAKIRLLPNKRNKTIKGKTLRVAVSIETRYAERLLAVIDRMTRIAEREVKRLFEADNYAGDYAMDANIGSQARILTNSLASRFDDMFARIAQPVTDTMIEQADNNSAATLKTSLRDIGADMTFSTDIMTAELRETIAASAAESVALIKRVPAKYLDNITGGVMRAITSGNGLEDIYPLLEKQKVEVRNWVKNVAMDQTRKVYNSINAGRMKALGMTKYEWVHSGGSNHPRAYHKDVLNGKIFSLEDPPIIDKKSGLRGKPGDAVYCLRGESKIEFTEGIHKLYRRKFRGELSRFITESGVSFETTGNHPILTQSGWVAAKDIKIGDYVVHAHHECGNIFKADITNVEPTIGNLFDAAIASVGESFSIVGGSELEFHGDISDGEIEIIDIDGSLPDKFNSNICKHLAELVFAGADEYIKHSVAHSFSPSDQTLLRALGTPDGIMSGLCSFLSLLRTHSAHADDVRQRLISDCAASLKQSSPDNISGYSELFSNLQFTKAGSVGRDNLAIRQVFALCGRAFNIWNGKAPIAQELGQIIGIAFQNSGDLTQTGGVVKQFDRIIEHRIVKDFFGHVYNIENEKNWFTTEGLIIHNCRCTMRPVINFDDDA